MANMGDEKKEGVTVQQIENFGKKHRIEIFFCIALILASCFSFPFYGPAWSIYAAGLGGAVAVWIPKHVGRIVLATMHFCLKQQRVTRIVIAVIGIVFSIFLPPVVFLCLGVVAGRSLHRHAIDAMKISDHHDSEHHN